ncbi:hypothetical protein JCM10914A_24770 [Paenibacillus sp. JCM 10914]|uniref:hypothetical protein n=1 Tax=Paenibacillus sp. JCM 10914 TaxID=1236974 RepID=UPI0003CC295E|nr:hypothetical protein [Paenibacillus sp. JCM 10914]GAE08963.1 hypothetical protein JCM10914_5300 [Paenibacillus sp. JCM 10914]
MLVMIFIQLFVIIGILLSINSKLQPRDFVADAMERDRKMREERERKFEQVGQD